MKKSRRLLAGALCAVMAGLVSLGGCGAQRTFAEPEPDLLSNDGAPAKLTVAIEVTETEALASKRGVFSRVLDEIIAKYRADFPNTEIELIEDVKGEKIAAGGADAPDIELFVGDDPYSSGQYPRNTDWLMDLTPYVDAWNDEGALSNPVSRIMLLKGGGRTYAIPCSYEQIMLYYRYDWLNEYNLSCGDNKDLMVSMSSWSGLLRVGDMLGDKGRLAISKSVRPYLFDAMLWSWTGHGSIADLSAGYYYMTAEGHGTIFSLESSVDAVNAYRELLDKDIGAADPMQAFIDGEAAMYLGTSLDILELEGAVPGTVGEDWYAVGLPSGAKGRVAPLLGWTAWGISKDTPEPEKALHFLRYLTNADNNTHMYMELKDYGAKPIYREVEDYEPSLLEGGWYGEVGLLNTPGYRYASPPLMFGEPVGVHDPVFSDLLGKLDSGDVTPEDMLEQLDVEYTRLMEEYLAKGNKLPWAVEDMEDNS